MRASSASRQFGEEVLADAVGAVVVEGRRAGGEVGDAALVVDAEFAPGVGAADVLPGVLRPGFVAEFAGVRHGVELPDELAGDDVVGAQVARRREVAFARGRAEDDQILEDLAGGAGLDAADGFAGSRPSPSRRSTTPFVAEGQDRLAGGWRRFPAGSR